MGLFVFLLVLFTYSMYFIHRVFSFYGLVEFMFNLSITYLYFLILSANRVYLPVMVLQARFSFYLYLTIRAYEQILNLTNYCITLMAKDLRNKEIGH